MLNMYSKVKMYEKLDVLMQEMNQKGIKCDSYTYSIRLNAYASASDIEGMEKLLMKMEVDPPAIVEWNWYITAANGYLIAGLRDKALEALREEKPLLLRVHHIKPSPAIPSLSSATPSPHSVTPIRLVNCYSSTRLRFSR
ncbi:hypothetical protein QQ045_000357 [Rhodiola kirilowii]